MMKRLLLLTLLFSFFTLNLQAKKVSVEEAKQVAKNFYYEKANQYFRTISYDDIVFAHMHVETIGDEAVYYAFNLDQGGFVIVSADDVLTPVFGYNFKGAYIANGQPDNYTGWMNHYGEMVKWARETNYQPENQTVNEWSHLRNTDYTQLNTRGGRDVDPLLISTWNQDSPYNALSPEHSSGPGGRCYAGCVATTMAQIMYYWRFPIHGSGDHSYYLPGYGTLSADFENTYYDWSAMSNDVTSGCPSQTIFAVAELQYHAGVAVNMNFGPNGSGAQSTSVAYALENYFNYSSDAVLANRSQYTLGMWEGILMENIDAGHPMYYAGDDGTTGHAFVCDGYQEGSTNYFHFNFGWSGSGDGYYTCADAGGFYYNQRIVKDIYPDDETFTYPYYCEGPSVINSLMGTIEDGSGPVENYENSSSCSWLLEPTDDAAESFTIGFHKFLTAPGDIVRIYDGETTASPLLGEYEGNQLPGEVTTTGDKALVTFETTGSGSTDGWQLYYDADQPSFCNMLTTFTEPTGTFTDGSEDYKYQGGTLCRWKIDIEDASSITLTFNTIDTEETYDHIQILDLATSPPTELGDFSGTFTPPSITGEGPLMVQFFTNLIINQQGWEIYYEADNVGLDDKEVFSFVNVYPNPASEAVSIDFKLEETQDVSIKLMSLTGNNVYTTTLNQVNGRNTFNLDVSEQAKGLYILQMVTNNGITNKRLIIN